MIFRVVARNKDKKQIMGMVRGSTIQDAMEKMNRKYPSYTVTEMREEWPYRFVIE